MRGLPHKNLAVETLRKLLSNEIKIRSRKFLIQSRSFAEPLEASIRKYQNRAIETAARELDTSARRLRVEFAGAIYHVMNRGDRREEIFRDDEDRQRFLQTLGEACAKTHWQLHAFCPMPNHFHLVCETPQPNLVAGMKWFFGTYTARFSRRHKLLVNAGEDIGQNRQSKNPVVVLADSRHKRADGVCGHRRGGCERLERRLKILR